MNSRTLGWGDWRLVVIFLVCFGAFRAWKFRSVTQPPGVLVSEEPEQKSYDPLPKSILYNDYVLDPLASYRIRGRILGTERYFIDRGAELSPIDVCVGWGAMSNSIVLEQLRFSQGNRFCFYSWENAPPMSDEKINSSMANMHIIPESDTIASLVKELRVGQIVTFIGELVRVNHRDGSEWKSSLSRTDTGNGACEVFYVRSIDVSP